MQTCSDGVRIFNHTYTNPLANCMASCGLRGPLSAVLGPCVDSCYCGIIPVWRTCHSRWNDRMGPKMGAQLDDPPDSRRGESRPQDHVWRRYTPHKTRKKHSENGGRHCGTPSCRLALMGPNLCAHLHDPPSRQHGLPRQRVVAISSSKAGSLPTLTYLKGYPTKIS